ncbi:hypothetical protein [Paenibacillus cymbidii]|uniref:hypothetical protein n=1 Tax=Paenibacillus cymbidii TaxID=1639034 RepID=UPI0010807A99|nr:hypothetical protein [Paenibacillus cymbidii]
MTAETALDWQMLALDMAACAERWRADDDWSGYELLLQALERLAHVAALPQRRADSFWEELAGLLFMLEGRIRDGDIVGIADTLEFDWLPFANRMKEGEPHAE